MVFLAHVWPSRSHQVAALRRGLAGTGRRQSIPNANGYWPGKRGGHGGNKIHDAHYQALFLNVCDLGIDLLDTALIFNDWASIFSDLALISNDLYLRSAFISQRFCSFPSIFFLERTFLNTY